MSYEIRYHPDGQWTLTKAGVNGRVVEVAQQERWEQLEDDEWLHVVVQRPATGFHQPAYVAEAWLKRALRSDGRWRESHSFETTRIALVADPAAPASPAPKPPAPPNHGGAQHIARTPYAIPGSERTRGDEPRGGYTVKALTKG